jgi:uncharacterized protein with HEPN domain
MSRDYKLYLEDIQQAAHKVEGYLQGVTFEQLRADEMRREAVLFNLQIIGEATKKLPDDFKSKYPAVEWRKITGLRDIIAHAYFNVNMQIIWDIIENKLPEFRSQIDAIIDEDTLTDSD